MLERYFAGLLGDGEKGWGTAVVGAEHHLAIFEELSAGVELVDSTVRQRVFPY